MVIGIVTISYNQGRFLEDAIRSVEVQSPHSLEYVVVDPGSQDNSRSIIESNKHKFFSRVLEQDRGPADGLNKGFSRLNCAEICGYLNADDRFTPEALDYVCDFFQANPSVDILFGGIYVIDSRGSRKLRGRYPMKVTLEGCADETSTIFQQGTFFRRKCFDAVGGFNIANRTCWDGELIVDLMLAGSRVGYTRKVLGEFRIHDASLTGSVNAKHQALYECDKNRIAQKIYASGCKVPSKTQSRMRNLLHRVNPYRHLVNLTTGAIGIADQKLSRHRP
jgi:glycosyltransferase involved in cell wall biosynthesis